MSAKLPVPTWASEPELLFDEDFTALLNAGVTSVGATAPEPLFDAHDQHWQVSGYGATAGTSSVATINTTLLGNPGVIGLQTGGATGNNIHLMYMREPTSQLHTEAMIAAKRLVGFEVTVNLTSTTGQDICIGFVDNAANGAAAANGIFFQAAGATWQGVCIASSVGTFVNGNAVATGRVQVAAYQRGRASWDFFMNRKFIGNVALNQPTADLLFDCSIKISTNSARLMTVDRARAWALASTRWS